MKSLRRLLPWLITAACFALLYQRIDAAAHRADSHLIPYLTGIFSRVDWGVWLALMIPYSLVYFAIDSLVLWRVINWFNARIRFVDILPVRASTYILSILNEQVGKGAMALYLHRREGVPGWQVGSSMLFIMFCEFYYLLGWATLGYALQRDALPAVFGAIPWLAAGALAFLALWIAYFRGAILPGVRLRERDILHAFRLASVRQYLEILLLRSPALLSAVLVYTLSLRLFGVDASFGQILGVLPVIFFGAAIPGPMRSVAITMWVTLIPERAGEMAAFGLVMHNFFIFFNAAFGLIFLRRANRELFGNASPAPAGAEAGGAKPAAARYMTDLHAAVGGDPARTVLFSFLDSAVAAIPTELAGTETTRRLLPFFLLGVVDAWCQAESCDDSTFHHLIEDVFSRYGIPLPSSAAAYASWAEQQIGEDASLYEAMHQGGIALPAFARDAAAFTDLSVLLLRANGLRSTISEVGGPVAGSLERNADDCVASGIDESNLSETQLGWIILRAAYYGLAREQSQGRQIEMREISQAIDTISREKGLTPTEAERRTAIAGAITLISQEEFLVGLVRSGWLQAHAWEPLPPEQRRRLDDVLAQAVADFQRFKSEKL